MALVTAASGREARRFTSEDFASIIRIAKVITADIRLRGPGTLLAYVPNRKYVFACVFVYVCVRVYLCVCAWRKTSCAVALTTFAGI